MLIEDSFVDAVLIEPLRQGADHLHIVSGYATSNMTSWLMKKYEDEKRKASLSLIIGMTIRNGLPEAEHKSFVELLQVQKQLDYVEALHCSYVYQGLPIHSKVYVWTKNEKPFLAFTGSANFTQPAFFQKQREILTEADPEQSWQYYLNAEKDSVSCNYNEIEQYIRFTCQEEPSSAGKTADLKEEQKLTLSLLTAKGRVGERSGLNWGQRRGRNPNEAYIPLPRKQAQSGFFPLDKQHFTVETDDGHTLILRVEQANNKAITTPLSNALLGEYFRNRLDLANGAFVRLEDLQRYGRTSVTFAKIDDEFYYMDFSSNKTPNL